MGSREEFLDAEFEFSLQGDGGGHLDHGAGFGFDADAWGDADVEDRVGVAACDAVGEGVDGLVPGFVGGGGGEGVHAVLLLVNMLLLGVLGLLLRLLVLVVLVLVGDCRPATSLAN